MLFGDKERGLLSMLDHFALGNLEWANVYQLNNEKHEQQ